MKIPLMRDTFTNFRGIECSAFYTKLSDGTKIQLYVPNNKKSSYDKLDKWYEIYAQDRYIYIQRDSQNNLDIFYQHQFPLFSYDLKVSDYDLDLLDNLIPKHE